MSYPTILGPWYVVQRLVSNAHRREVEAEFIEYYTSMEEGEETWTPDTKRAMIFMSLHSAVRVAAAEGAHVRVLTSKEEADEFARGL